MRCDGGMAGAEPGVMVLLLVQEVNHLVKLKNPSLLLQVRSGHGCTSVL